MSIGATLYERAIMLDTGPLISLYNPSDSRGNQIQEILRSVVTSCFPLCVTITVISETHSRLLYDVNRTIAYRFLNDYYQDISNQDLNLIDITIADFADAVRIIGKYSDQAISFTDALVMAVMKRIGIRTVLTYDHHFWLLNFSVIP
ncbi:MAG: PIN domain-containing protein [Chloroflexota bacterium]